MQIQENTEYDVKRLRHADNVAHPRSGKLRGMLARFNPRRPDEIRERE